MSTHWTFLIEAGKYVAGGAAALGSSILARKKSREDHNLVIIAEGIKTWKEIAEANKSQAEINKSHWDMCEGKCDKLEKMVSDQAATISELRSKVTILEYQIRGKSQLDE